MREPNWRRYLRFWRSSAELDVEDELRFHFRERVEELMATGLSADDARVAAAEKFGDVARARAALVASTRRLERRRTWGERIRDVLQDVRRVLRGFRAEPVLGAGIVLTLAAGIGANTAMFDILDRLLFRPPAHVVDAARVERFYFGGASPFSGPYHTPVANYPAYAAITRTPAFDGVAAYALFGTSVGAGASAWSAKAALVSSGYFALLGTRPVLGRAFVPEEEHAGYGDPGVMLSSEIWRTRFGGDSAIIGKRIDIDGWRYPVVGIAPPEFSGVEQRRVDLWLPLSAAEHGFYVSDWSTNDGSFWLNVIGRIRRGIAPAGAEAQASVAYRGFLASTPRADSTAHVRLVPVTGARTIDGPTAEARVSAWLAGIAAIVFIIACANVATLLLLRAMRHRREIAIRRALGMSDRRLAVHLLLESLVLAVIGGAAALVSMRWVSGPLRAVLLPDVAWTSGALSVQVAAITIAGVLVAALLTGCVPLVGMVRGDLTDELKSGGHGTAWHRGRAHTVLLVGQGALSVVLLVGAGLFMRSLHRAQSLDFGYDLAHVLKVQIHFPKHGSFALPPEAERLYAQALARAQRIPGVTRVALGESDPGGWSYGMSVGVPGRDSLPRAEGGGPYVTAVTPDYFATIGTPVLRGRGITSADGPGTERVAVISKSMADLYWPRSDPLGTCIHLGSEKGCTRVVGIAGDIRQYGVMDSPRLWVYTPWSQSAQDASAARGFERRGYTLFVRTSGDAEHWEQRVRSAIQGLEPALPYVSAQTLESVIDPQLRPWRLGATMLIAFGLLATALATIGLYSVVAYTVAQRRREMGIRTALGAQRRDLVQLVVADGTRIAIVGAVLGVALGAAFGHYVGGMLFRTPGFDPLVLGGAGAALVIVAVLASAVPAWRAGHVDAAAVLKTD